MGISHGFHGIPKSLLQPRIGVDDLYTDPQIHTASESTTNPRFGRGNMGLRGMALFFASHRSSV